MDEAILGGSGPKGHRGSGGRSLGVGGPGVGRTVAAPRWGTRGLPVLAVVLLIAALCPLVPAAPAGAAARDLIELPENFTATAISDNGDIAGTLFTPGFGNSFAIWSGGELTTVPIGNSTSVFVHHIGDDGVAVGTANGLLYSFDKSGLIRTIPRPTVEGSERYFQKGWRAGSDTVIGVHNYAFPAEQTGLTYRGASPPTAITQIATVMAANYAGQVFGQIPGKTLGFGILGGGGLSPVGGLGIPQKGYLQVKNMSDEGHILYRTWPDGTHRVWHDGSSRVVNSTNATQVNSEGVVLGAARFGEADEAALHFEDGTVTSVRSLVGGAPGYSRLDSGAINDNCDVVGFYVKDDGSYGSYLAHTGGCNPIDIEGEFFRVDGGSAYVKIGDDADVRLRVENASSQELTNVSITSTEVVEDDSGGKATLSAAGGLSPTTLAAQGPSSVGFADFTLKGEEAGTVTLRAEISATKNGDTVTGTIEREFEVRKDDLVVNLKLDPPEYEEADDGTFDPVDITVTVSFTNSTDGDHDGHPAAGARGGPGVLRPGAVREVQERHHRG